MPPNLVESMFVTMEWNGILILFGGMTGGQSRG